jgi:cytoskeletal protein CcmA (bactofilin family)
MFGGKKKNSAQPAEPAQAQIAAYLGKGTVFEGRLEFKGAAHIGGVFKGEIISDGLLIVGAKGEVTGHVVVGALQSSGCVAGEIEAASKVSLLASSKTEAGISTQRMEVDEGAQFDGAVKMRR